MEIYGFYNGEKKSLTQLAAENGVSYDTLLARYKAGVPFGELVQKKQASAEVAKAVFIPSVDAAGNISWTNDAGLDNPPASNIRGPQGERGPQGPQGEKGEKGNPGSNGIAHNLLDNWYFANPVNQRGQAEYSEPTWAELYSIDRWGLSVASYNVQNKKLTALANYSRITQRINDKSLIGKTVTFSALISSVANTNAGILVSDGAGDYALVEGQAGIISTTFTVRDFGDKTLNLSVLGITAGGMVVIEAVKLELGNTQTLAHQDANGNWVLNEIPKYSEQLAECQRYYQKINFRYYGTDLHTETQWPTEFPVQFFCPMRINPTASYSAGYQANLSSFSLGVHSDRSMVVKMSATSKGVYGAWDGAIYLSADL